MNIAGTPTIYRGFVNEGEKSEMKLAANQLLAEGLLAVNNANPGGLTRFKSFYAEEEMLSIQKLIYHRIIQFLCLDNPVIDPMLGAIISVMSPGGRVHSHLDHYRDAMPEFSEMRNIRFNVMVQRGPSLTYDPVISDKSWPVGESDAWCFSASEYHHETRAIVGVESRIVYQYGFLMP